MSATPFAAAEGYRPIATVAIGDLELPAAFTAPEAEFDLARRGVVLMDRSDRALIRAAGKDRQPWLHNLVTNAVKTLPENTGNYAFACDLRGRCLFDLNVLVLADELWLDVDRVARPAALQHLERHCIMEDVQLRSSDEFARLGVTGPDAARIAGELGFGNFPAMAALGHAPLSPNAGGAGGGRFVRHDFAGLPGFELHVPLESAAAWWRRLAVELTVPPAGWRTLDALRIEAGIPWLGRDIDEKVIPPETGQVERGISYHKGCYLGQEIIERMRSHGSLARRLVRLVAEPGGPDLGPVSLPAILQRAGQEAGRVTSLVRHPASGRWIGLGYVRTKLPDLEGLTIEPGGIAVRAAGE